MPLSFERDLRAVVMLLALLLYVLLVALLAVALF